MKMRLDLEQKEVRAILILCDAALRATAINEKGKCGELLLVDLRCKLKDALQSKGLDK